MKDVFKLLCTLFCALIISNCGQGLIDEIDTPIEENNPEDLLIEPGDTPINANEAENVALLYVKKSSVSTKGEVKVEDVGDIFTIKDGDGSPLMYAVNFNDNKGYVIVSACRKYYPILAIVEEGHFDESFNKQVLLGNWVDEQSEQIRLAANNGLTENVVKIMRSLWSAYEKKISTVFITTKSEADAFALRQASVAAWEEEGYTCYSLMEQPSEMPTSTYNNWCQIAEGLANHDYDYMTYSVILERRFDDSTGVAPLIGATWERENGYNAYFVNSLGNPMPLPSRAVALGQIMRKYQKPAGLNWSNMALTYANSYNAEFLAWVTSRLGSIYWYNGEDPTDNVVMYTLQNKFSYSASLGTYSRNTVISNLSNGKPVYLSGTRTVGGTSTNCAWVCEGYLNSAIHYEYELKVLSMTEPLEYEHGASYVGNQFGFANYLYHNLGLGGSLNGWYISDTFSAGTNTMQSSNMIYNITAP